MLLKTKTQKESALFRQNGYLAQERNLLVFLKDGWNDVLEKYRFKKAQRMISRLVQKEDGETLFSKLTEEKKLKKLSLMQTSQQVYDLVCGVPATGGTDFQHSSEQVREAILSRLLPEDKRKLLMQRSKSEWKEEITFSNFSFANERRKYEFLFGILTHDERMAFLNKNTGLERISFLSNRIVSEVFSDVQTKAELDELLVLEKGALYWPQNMDEKTQQHIVSLIPKEEYLFYFRQKTQKQKALLLELSPSVRKTIYRSFDGHPHLMKRFTEGLWTELTWPEKKEIALKMNNKKYVLALFETPCDKTGRVGFYHAPYEKFRKALYQKFPELDQYESHSSQLKLYAPQKQASR